MLKKKYYVLTHIESHDRNIMPFDDLDEALAYYKESLDSDVVLVQRLDVNISVINLNGEVTNVPT